MDRNWNRVEELKRLLSMMIRLMFKFIFHLIYANLGMFCKIDKHTFGGVFKMIDNNP